MNVNVKSIPIYKRLFLMPMFFATEEKATVGGQALVEGVMMRGKEKIAWAVRRPNGEIVVESHPFVSVTKRIKMLGLPIIRGLVGLFESMKWGYRALSRSADLAIEEEGGVSPLVDAFDNANNTDILPAPQKTSGGIGDKILIALSMMFAMALSVSLFMYAPMWLANRIPFVKDTPIYFNLTAGAVRIGLLLIYMTAISFWSDVRRVFEYHGAEHKSILAFEDGKELTFENIDPYTTIHPRCGTSFLVLVAIVGILMSSIIDTLYIQRFGEYVNLFHRFGVRLIFIPLLAGVSFEALKLSAKYKDVPIVNILILPGLLVQRITTKRPDEMQVEVAVKALKAVV